MLIYWLPFIIVLLLRSYRSHRHFGDGGYVSLERGAIHPSLDRVLAVVTGRTALGVTILFGLFTVGVLVVGLAGVPSGATTSYCLRHIAIP